jgi:tetratricopeptide (TPR) repeat protein
MLYYYFGDCEVALEKYQQALEISERIGDIAGAAGSRIMIGHIYFIKKDYAPALKMFLQSFRVLSKIGSPNAKVAKGNIDIVREKMSVEEFREILIDSFGTEEEDEKKKL